MKSHVQSHAVSALGAFLVFWAGISGCDLFGGQGQQDETPDIVVGPDPNFPERPNGNEPPKTDSLKPAFALALPSRVLHLDSTYRLTWSADSLPKNALAQLDLFRDSLLIMRLFQALPNSGVMNLDLPDVLRKTDYAFGAGEGYRLRLQSDSVPGLAAFSPVFELHSPVQGEVEVKTPQADSIAYLDSSLAVTWVATGETGSAMGLQLFKDSLRLATLATQIPNTGTFLWSDIPTAYGIGDGFRLRVFSMRNPSVSGLSAPFRIAPPLAPQLTFEFPRTGDSVRLGDTVTVTWNVDRKFNALGRMELWKDSSLVVTLGYSIPLDSGTWIWRSVANLPSDDDYRLRLNSTTTNWDGFSEPFTLIDPSVDAYEKDDSLGLARPIGTDGKAQDRFCGGGDTDWIRFDADTGKYYVIDITTPISATTSVTLGLYGANGVAHQGGQTGKALKIAFLPRESGPVFVNVSGAVARTAYSIAVNAFSWNEQAAHITFTQPDSSTVWALGGNHLIGWRADNPLYGNTVKFGLYRDTTFVSTISTLASNSGAYSWTLPTLLPKSDRYRVRIAHGTDTRIFAFSDYFTVNGIIEDAFEPDNNRAQAKAIPVSDSAQSRTLHALDPDWLRFEAKPDHAYFLIVECKSVTVSAAIYDSLGSLLVNLSGSRLYLPLQAGRSGQHFAQISSTTAGNPAYTTRLLAVEQGGEGVARLMIAPDSQAEWKAGSAATMTWVKDSIVLGNQVSLTLYRDAMPILPIVTYAPNSGQYTWTLPSSLASGSNYRVRIHNGAYPTLFAFSQPFVVDGAASDSLEPDPKPDSVLTSAVLLGTGESLSRNLTYNDTDWVRIKASADSTYIISFTSAATTSLQLFDSARTVLHTASGLQLTFPFRPLASGNYGFKMLSPFGFQTNSPAIGYTLGITSFAHGAGGLPVSFSEPDTLTTWAAGSAYTLAWQPDTTLFSRTVSLALFHDTTLVFTLGMNMSNSGAATMALPLGLASSNKYRIRLANSTYPSLFGFSRPFSISGILADAFEPNESAAAAKPFEVNQAPQELSLTSLDKDWFRFAGKAQKLYQFRTTHGPMVYQSFSLWSATGANQIFNVSHTNSDTVRSVAWFCNTEAEYLFAVQPYSTASGYLGPYTLEIRELESDDYTFAFTSPVADTSVPRGQAFTIRWSDPAQLKGMVDIFLYNANGVVQTIAANVINSGVYTWTIPAALPARDDYSIRVSSRWSATVFGMSPVFAIGVD